MLRAEYHGMPVAVKRLHRSKVTEAGLAAFKAEAELMLSLHHPNIVGVFGVTYALDCAQVHSSRHASLLRVLLPLPVGAHASFLPCLRTRRRCS